MYVQCSHAGSCAVVLVCCIALRIPTLHHLLDIRAIVQKKQKKDPKGQDHDHATHSETAESLASKNSACGGQVKVHAQVESFALIKTGLCMTMKLGMPESVSSSLSYLILYSCSLCNY